MKPDDESRSKITALADRVAEAVRSIRNVPRQLTEDEIKDVMNLVFAVQTMVAHPANMKANA